MADEYTINGKTFNFLPQNNTTNPYGLGGDGHNVVATGETISNFFLIQKETADATTGSADDAADSATAAASSASSASTSASTATTQASTATTKASEASTSASAAATSASSASTSASTATTQASNASTSATNASNSATAAATSAAAIGYSYTYSTTTTASDPGSGILRFNNATLASATALYISETTANSQSIAADLATWDDGTSTSRGRLKMYKASAPNTFALFDITGTITDGGSWDTFVAAYVAGSGSFSDTDAVTLLFTQKGDKGDTGSTGATGATYDISASSDDTYANIVNVPFSSGSGAAGNKKISKASFLTGLLSSILATVGAYTKQQNFTAASITSSSNSIAWNLDDAQSAKHTFTENTTLANPTNMVDGGTYVLKLTQHSSSPKTLAYGSAYKFPGGTAFTVSAVNSAVDILTFISDGTNMYCVGQKGFA